MQETNYPFHLVNESQIPISSGNLPRLSKRSGDPAIGTEAKRRLNRLWRFPPSGPKRSLPRETYLFFLFNWGGDPAIGTPPAPLNRAPFGCSTGVKFFVGKKSSGLVRRNYGGFNWGLPHFLIKLCERTGTSCFKDRFT